MARNVNSEVLDSPISNNLTIVWFHVIDRGVVDLTPLDDLMQLSKDIYSLGLLLKANAIFLPIFIVRPSRCRCYAFPEGGGVFIASCSSPSLVDDCFLTVDIDSQFQEIMPLPIARIVRLAVVKASVLIVKTAYHTQQQYKTQDLDAHLYNIQMMKLHSLAISLVILFSQVSSYSIKPIDAEAIFNKSFCNGCQSCHYNAKNVYIPETGYFTPSKISNNKYGIKNISSIIDSVTSDYWFPKENITEEMGYVVFYPDTPVINGVVLYFHPTLFGKLDKPTNLGNQILALGSLYASQNYVFVVIDYIGYSDNSTKPHPYIIFPFQNIQSGFAALNKIAQELLRRYYGSKFKLFTAGYSEGAGYSVWTPLCLLAGICQGQNLTLSSVYDFRGAVGMQGAYALETVVLPFLTEYVGLQFRGNQFDIEQQPLVNIGKPGLLAMTLNSYFAFSKSTGSMASDLQRGFYQMKCDLSMNQSFCINPFPKRLTIPEALNTSQYQSEAIAKAIGFSAFGKRLNQKTYLTGIDQFYWVFHTNSINSLVTDKVLNPQFTTYLRNASLIGQKTSAPTYLFSLKRDSLVSVFNTIKFAGSDPKIKSFLFQNINHLVCIDSKEFRVDHNGAQVLANLFALNFMNEHL